jgi:hypothetical protein
MIDFEELLDEALLGRNKNSELYKLLDGRIFIARVNDDGEPELDVYDMNQFKELVVILVQMFCEEKGLSSFEEIKEHEA